MCYATDPKRLKQTPGPMRGLGLLKEVQSTASRADAHQTIVRSHCDQPRLTESFPGRTMKQTHPNHHICHGVKTRKANYRARLDEIFRAKREHDIRAGTGLGRWKGEWRLPEDRISRFLSYLPSTAGPVSLEVAHEITSDDDTASEGSLCTSGTYPLSSLPFIEDSPKVTGMILVASPEPMASIMWDVEERDEVREILETYSCDLR